MNSTYQTNGRQLPRPPCVACDGNTSVEGAEPLPMPGAPAPLWLCRACVDRRNTSTEAAFRVYDEAFRRSGAEAAMRQLLRGVLGR